MGDAPNKEAAEVLHENEEVWGWAVAVTRVRLLRRSMLLSQRNKFDAALRPFIGGHRIAYPAAFYHITNDDIERALKESAE